ncbi:MAG: hypothetical protein E7629_04035 [Ruminococcaceae bacterium]|nr:hypothetical protein [Oscillospiraceae bacterium]
MQEQKMQEQIAEEEIKQEPLQESAQEPKKKRRRRFGDRSDGYKLRTINPMNKIMPYIMPQRCDACNTYADMFDVTKTDKFCRQKVKEGKTSFGFLHVMLAAYIRMLSQRPAVNRFVSGQKIYARKDIQIVMTIKKTLSLDSPDTCIKVRFNPDDTIDEVYEKFNAAVSEVQSKPDEKNSFDKLNKALVFIPGLFLRWTVKLLNFLDYFGLLPKFLLWLSPFHGSMIITSMGSLGIRPIYHHIYNFGNLPVFLAYGGRRSVVACDADGKAYTKKYIELKAVTDERICDGYYYASAFKLIKRYVENPELLETKPEEVIEDID